MVSQQSSSLHRTAMNACCALHLRYKSPAEKATFLRQLSLLGEQLQMKF